MRVGNEDHAVGAGLTLFADRPHRGVKLLPIPHLTLVVELNDAEGIGGARLLVLQLPDGLLLRRPIHLVVDTSGLEDQQEGR